MRAVPLMPAQMHLYCNSSNLAMEGAGIVQELQPSDSRDKPSNQARKYNSGTANKSKGHDIQERKL